MGGLTEQPADGSHSLEEGLGEAGPQAHGSVIRQTQDDGSVLGPEEEAGVGQDPILVQRPVGLQQPSPFLFPPNGVVRPVLLAVWGPQEKGALPISLGGPCRQPQG